MEVDNSRLKTCRIRFWVWCFFGILQGSGGNSIRWVCKRCTWSSWLPEYWCWRSVVHYVVNFTKARQWDLDVVQLSVPFGWACKGYTWSSWLSWVLMLKIKVHYLVDSTKTVYRRQFTRNLYQCSMLEDQDLMQFLKNGTLIKCWLEYWKINGRSVNWDFWGNCTTPNLDTRTLRGKLYTMSIKILLTWIIGQGGICQHREDEYLTEDWLQLHFQHSTATDKGEFVDADFVSDACRID